MRTSQEENHATSVERHGASQDEEELIIKCEIHYLTPHVLSKRIQTKRRESGGKSQEFLVRMLSSAINIVKLRVFL